jgi:hypothetical protein
MDQIVPQQPASDACPNCGQAAMAAYCSQCGEKRREHADWKLSRLASEAFAEFTNLEHSKIWQTFRLLLFKPGQLTRDYWSGRRKSYLGPVKLYLVFFALSLILYSIHRPTAVYDVRTLAAADSTGDFSRVLDKLAEKRGVPTAQVIQELNSRWQSYLSMSQVVYPLFVALALKLLLRRRGLYFAEHLIFALHTLAFMLLSFAIQWPLLVLFGIQSEARQYTAAYIWISIAALVWMIAYLFLALRRAYGEAWLAALVKSAVILLTYLLTSMLFMSAAFALAITLTKRGG